MLNPELYLAQFVLRAKLDTMVGMYVTLIAMRIRNKRKIKKNRRFQSLIWHAIGSHLLA